MLSFSKKLLPILIVVLTLAAYYPALRGGFVWDDDYYVSRNPHMSATDGLLRIRPYSARAHYNLGTVYLRQGKSEAAIASYERAVELDPTLAEKFKAGINSRKNAQEAQK